MPRVLLEESPPLRVLRYHLHEALAHERPPDHVVVVVRAEYK